MEKTGSNTLTMTIRIPASLRDSYTKWSAETGTSRNRLINLALSYGLEHIVIADKSAEADTNNDN